MKKFLSLLLALTLVLSLVVVPARATDENSYAVTATAGNPSAQVSVVKVNTNVTFTATAPTNIKVGESDATVTGHAWAVNNQTVSGNDSATLSQAFSAAGKYTVSCTYTLTYDSNKTTTAVASASVTVYDCATAFTGVTFNHRPYAKPQSGNIAVYYDSTETNDLNDASKWSVTPATGYSVVTTDGYPKFESDKLMVKIKYNDVEGSVEEVAIPITATPVSATSLTADKPSAMTGTKLTFTLAATKSDRTNLAWYYKSTAADSQYVPMTVTKNQAGGYEWIIPNNITGNSATGTYTVACFLKESGTPTTTDKVKAETSSFTVTKDTNILTYNPNVAATRGSTVNLSLTFTDKDGNKVNGALDNVAWDYTPKSGATPGTPEVTSDGKVASNKLTINANSTASSYTVTAKFSTGGKDYVATYTVTVKSLTAAISPIQNNTPVTLYGYNYGYNYSYITNNNLFAIAQAALNTASISATVSYVTLDTGSRTNCYIQRTSGSSSAYYTYTITGTSIGTASFTGTVYTNKGNYPITFTATVTPISTTYEAQYPEPVAYGNTYRYYVQVPAGASYYYVVGTPNQATTPTDFSQSGKTVYYANTTSTNLYPLTDSNFVGGQCTLWIVTKNSSDNRLYYGQLTVYQKNYNISYNGVAGETVQFAQSDFNDFMNKVAEARGDASKAKSYPYVTFDYVTFSLPTTAQGTLYYGGTAMSTSNSSGAFNRNTKVTNLDSVTFVPNAKSTAKTITLNFTLYATRYSSSSTSRGTTVSYSGSVVVNLVREDIKYTVSQGDSVRFDESDFLSYLRSTKGYSSNYTIDYVTFDQSAVSAVNEGSLYTYYNGYNYGGSIKTTDKFYYSATASQNALSDVAFLASRYAKTGETVYIPFTIYARYGTTGTGTRQLTGTVAIKIGQTMNFIDVKTTDYFYNSVKWAVGKNITNGTSSTTFSPYKSCTRAEIVTFLWRAAGSPEPTTTRNPFRDVNAVTHSSYYKAILWASQKGITSGTSTTAFSPDQVCTRAQIVTFLYRYAGKPSGYYSNPFKDVSATNEASYYNAILWASGKGITTGSSPTTFSPYASCNRAEAVTFLYRYTNGL